METDHPKMCKKCVHWTVFDFCSQQQDEPEDDCPLYEEDAFAGEDSDVRYVNSKKEE